MQHVNVFCLQAVDNKRQQISDPLQVVRDNQIRPLLPQNFFNAERAVAIERIKDMPNDSRYGAVFNQIRITKTSWPTAASSFAISRATRSAPPRSYGSYKLLMTQIFIFVTIVYTIFPNCRLWSPNEILRLRFQ